VARDTCIPRGVSFESPPRNQLPYMRLCLVLLFLPLNGWTVPCPWSSSWPKHLQCFHFYYLGITFLWKSAIT